MSHDIMASFRQVGWAVRAVSPCSLPPAPAATITHARAYLMQDNQVSLGMDVHVQVLTSGFWPR